MKERGITLYPEEIQALQEHGTVTIWRVIKPQPRFYPNQFLGGFDYIGFNTSRGSTMVVPADEFRMVILGWCPFGQVGDKLWVRETWWTPPDNWNAKWCALYSDKPAGKEKAKVIYRETFHAKQFWLSPIYMPRWASRFDLGVMQVRVEKGESWKWVLELKKEAGNETG